MSRSEWCDTCVLVPGGAGFLGSAVVAPRAAREFGFRARTPFAEGLERTVRWYLERRAAGR